MVRIVSVCASVILIGGLIGWVAAQEGKDASGPGGERVVTINQMVETAFRVEPVVQRLKAGRGEVVPFSYSIESNGKSMDVELKVVALRQEENGAILHDETSAPTTALKLSTPKDFAIAPGKAMVVKGELTVPLTKTNFHSFGILVRDQGQIKKLNPKVDAQGKRLTQAGVRFITQYVLRCDVEVTNGSGAKVGDLKIEQAELAEQDGWAVARAYLSNPTDSAVECSVRCTIPGLDTASRAKFFPLGLPSRADMDERDRYVVRILPHSRVRVEAPTASAVPFGDQKLQIEVVAGQARGAKDEFPVKVELGDFPAQESLLARTEQSLAISPGRVLLSKIKGGKTALPIILSNPTAVAQEVELETVDLQGHPLVGLALSAKRVVIKPNSAQTVTAMIKTQKGLDKPIFGFLRVTPAGQGAPSAAATKIPVALMYGEPTAPKVTFTELALHSSGANRKFVVQAKNEGAGFAPIHGSLTLADERGTTLRMRAGYGKWLLPGETADLIFKPNTAIPDGSYQVKLSLSTSDGQPAIETTTNIRIGPSAESPPASSSASTTGAQPKAETR